MHSVYEDRVPLSKDAAVPVELRLGAGLQNDFTLKLAVVVPAEFQSIWSDDVPPEISWSSGCAASDGDVVNLACDAGENCLPPEQCVTLFSGVEKSLKHVSDGADSALNSSLGLVSLRC